MMSVFRSLINLALCSAWRTQWKTTQHPSSEDDSQFHGETDNKQAMPTKSAVLPSGRCRVLGDGPTKGLWGNVGPLEELT